MIRYECRNWFHELDHILQATSEEQFTARAPRGNLHERSAVPGDRERKLGHDAICQADQQADVQNKSPENLDEEGWDEDWDEASDPEDDDDAYAGDKEVASGEDELGDDSEYDIDEYEDNYVRFHPARNKSRFDDVDESDDDDTDRHRNARRRKADQARRQRRRQEDWSGDDGRDDDK
jgi:hypothetical protein